MGFEPTSPRILVGCDNHYTTTAIEGVIYVVRDGIYVGLPGNFAFEGDRVVEAYNSICNPSKDQFNDARHKANLVGYKGGSIHH